MGAQISRAGKIPRDPLCYRFIVRVDGEIPIIAHLKADNSLLIREESHIPGGPNTRLWSADSQPLDHQQVPLSRPPAGLEGILKALDGSIPFYRGYVRQDQELLQGGQSALGDGESFFQTLHRTLSSRIRRRKVAS